MTTNEAEAAIRAAGVGWDQVSGRFVLSADESPGACNRTACASVAAAATRSGASAEDLGTAVRAQVDGDSTLLRLLLA